jgi:hypothetical protein
VFQSIASIARSCSIVWVNSTSTAPSNATFVRSTRSVAISASARTKMITASVTSSTRTGRRRQ